MLTVNPCGVGIGRDAYFRINIDPQDYPDENIIWTTSGNGSVEFVGGNTGRNICVRGLSPGDVSLDIQIGSRTNDTPLFALKVVENVQVKISAWIIGDRNGVPRTTGEIQEMVKAANDIYSQVGMSFYVDSITMTNILNVRKIYLEDRVEDGSLCFSNITEIASQTGGLECYFIDKFADDEDVRGVNWFKGLVIAKSATDKTLAHEIGHACGLEDIYVEKGGCEISNSEIFCWHHAISDWNGGSCGAGSIGGSRYYKTNTSHAEIIRRLLMLGQSNSEDRRCDISFGIVDGVVNCIDMTSTQQSGAVTGILDGIGTTRQPYHQ